MALTGVAFTLAFLLGCGLALTRHPIFGLVTYVLVFFLHPPDRWWGQGVLLHVRWSLLAAAVAILAVVVRKRPTPAITFLSHTPIKVLLLFLVWTIIQIPWVLDVSQQLVLIEYYAKFVVAMWLVYRCIETERHLLLFLWSYVLGCFYLAWLAFTSYTGGRFDWFGGPGIGDANAGALTLVTALLIAGSLLLVSVWKYRVALLGMIPIILDGMVTTISRSGFLAFAMGGLIFNLFTPRRFRGIVLGLSCLALIVFMAVTNQTYWERIASIAHEGQEVEGIDTGSSRIPIMQAQLRMFRGHPFGCGHFCTDVLSGSYLDSKYLTLDGARSSHNTFLSFLVDQGVVGGMFYLTMGMWAAFALVRLAKRFGASEGELPGVFPAIAACLGALLVADMFVPYVRYEPRFWFIAIIMVMLKLTALPRTGHRAQGAA